MDEIKAGGILLATKTGTGEPIPIEDGGPLRIVFVGGVPVGSQRRPVDLERHEDRRQMTGFDPDRRWGQRLMVAIVVAVTLGTITMVGVNASQLREVTADVQTTRVQSINVTNANRECLLLLQLVSQLGETSTVEQVDVQRGVMLRQIAVSIASFPPDSPGAREMVGVRDAIVDISLGELWPARAGTGQPRLTATQLVADSERRINGLRTGQEKYFY